MFKGRKLTITNVGELETLQFFADDKNGPFCDITTILPEQFRPGVAWVLAGSVSQEIADLLGWHPAGVTAKSGYNSYLGYQVVKPTLTIEKRNGAYLWVFTSETGEIRRCVGSFASSAEAQKDFSWASRFF